MNTWEILSNSFFFASTMDGAFPTSLNWSNVETLLRLYHIKPHRMLIKRIRLAENLAIKQAAETLKKE